MPFFSICIPNYNYEKYLGITLDSVLGQQFGDLEILVADNASTDKSLEVVRAYQERDSRIKWRRNNINVGFAGNLGKSAEMATGEWMTMLSSDDLLHSECLMIYKGFIEELGEVAPYTILSSAQDVIDGDGKKFRYIGVDWKVWKGAERHARLSEIAGADVWIMDANQLLRNSLQLIRTPFAFASTTYSRQLYASVEGYSQGGIINPDKKFAWAILAKAQKAIFVDKPLVSYRVHNQNQGSQQARSGALKFFVDEYVSTFQIDNDVLAYAGITREDFEKAFVEQDIALRGLAAMADGQRAFARRVLDFGRAAYPQHCRKNKKVMILRSLLLAGPLGVMAARRARERYQKTWEDRITKPT